MKLTELGKETRKIRIGREEVLLDMAKRLNMSPAMLSAIEVGTKPAPDDFVARLASQYEEAAERRAEFEHLAELTKRLVKVQLEPSLGEDAKEAAITFARVLPQLNSEDLAALTRVFEKYKKGMYDKKIEGRDM